MTRIFNISVAITLAVAFLLAVLLGSINTASAHNGTRHTEVTQATSAETAEPSAYKYVAQIGDSYAQFARKAVQTHGIVKKVNLSQAQIIYAETALTHEAGSPLLALGESRSLSESSVKTVVDKAAKLTATQVAAWNAYTVGVDFNTNKVGQAN